MADEVSERSKYETMWGFDSYRERSPGMRHLNDALKRLQPEQGASILDLGCGTGRVSQALVEKGYSVTAVDIAENACTEFDGSFVAGCLWELPNIKRHEYGFCADVMEHLPTDKVTEALYCISRVAGKTYFQIANFHCHEGDKIGEHLHLTVKPFRWWEKELSAVFDVEYGKAENKHHIFVCKSRVS